MATRKYSNKRKRRVNRFDVGGNIIIPGLGDLGINTVTDISNNPIPNSLIQTPAATGLSPLAKGAIGAVGGIVGNIGGQLIGGGLQSDAGNAISGIGSAVGAGLSAVNPVLGGVVSAGSGLLGGITNALFGSKLNKENIAKIENSNTALNTLQIDDSSTESVLDQFGDTTFGQSFSRSDIGSDGLFSNKAKNTYKRLQREQDEALARAYSNFGNAINNVKQNQVTDTLRNFAAYGGPITMRYTGPMSPFGNQFADGGSIYIRPENRGKFTALKKRTGKSATWFKEHGTPAQKKMAVFALNARKWKHNNGGFLNGNNEDSGIFLYNSRPFGLYNTGNVEGHIKANGGPKEGGRQYKSQANTALGELSENLGVNPEVGDLVSSGLSFVPIVGTALGIADLGRDIYNGATGRADVNASDYLYDVVGLLPGGKAITAIGKGSKALGAGKVANTLLKTGRNISRNTTKGVRSASKRISEVAGDAYNSATEAALSRGSDIYKNAMKSRERSKAAKTVADDIYNTMGTNAFRYNQLRTGAKAANAVHDSGDNLEGLANWMIDWRTNKKAKGGFLNNQHGGIFDNGVTTIGNGGTHEQNPFEGIQLGVDNQGIPNLVEEGEVIFNDYVYSNRIKAPKEVKKKYKLRGNTFADLAENAQKESEERPNDPISQRGLQDIMAKLAMEQESIKARKEERKANKYAKGGHLYPDGGFTYGTDMLNLDRSINTADLYKQGSNYMNARQYVLDNWDTPYVQDWLNNYYKPFVTSYNKSRGYNGSFNVNRDQFEKGTYDSSFGGMHQGLLNFQYPEGNTGVASPYSDAVTAYTLRNFLGNPVRSYAPGSEPSTYMGSGLTTSTYVDADGNTINYLDPSLSPSKKSADSTVETSKGKGKGNKANPLTYLRYAPILGSAIGLTQGLLSKPDYSNADAILEASRDAGRYMPVDYKPVGNYLTYTPFDRDYYINKANAQASATRRAITGQSAGNRATAMAGLLAADYNAQNNLGNLARQAAEYNFANRQAVETFNRGTNMFNSEQALKAAMANQDAYSRSAASRLQGTAQAMAMRQAIDNARNAGIAANFTNIFQGLGDIGREEVERSWIEKNPYLYYDTSTTGRGINYKGNNNSKSYGGYITRKNKKKGGKR